MLPPSAAVHRDRNVGERATQGIGEAGDHRISMLSPTVPPSSASARATRVLAGTGIGLGGEYRGRGDALDADADALPARHLREGPGRLHHSLRVGRVHRRLGRSTAERLESHRYAGDGASGATHDLRGHR